MVTLNRVWVTCKYRFRQSVRPGDTSGILVDIEVPVHVTELSSGDADTVTIKINLVAVAFLEEVSH